MRSKIKRKPRRARHLEAWIFLGEQRCHCAVLNSSEDGAKLTLSEAGVLPKEFLLGFSIHIGNVKKCEIAWRRGTTIGIKYRP